jgi:hypothetical protein
MKRFFYFCLFLVFSFAFIINPQAFAAGKTLYDDFSSNYIDGSKWQQRTFVREIVNGKYVSKFRTPNLA